MTSSQPGRLHVVVTGASGFIGRVLVARTREAGHEVTSLSRADGSLPGGYEDADALGRAFAGADVVVHLAARAHRGGTDADFECNVRAARAVAQGARSAGIRRLVLLSSIGVNGNVTTRGAFTENDPAAPVEPYARSKLRAEREVQAVLSGSSTEWVIVRPPLVYGPNAPGNFARLVHAVARGWPLPLRSVRNHRSLIAVDNLSDLILLCTTHPAAANELFLVADADDIATPEMISCIARGLGTASHLWRAPPALLKLCARLANRPRIAESLCDSLQVDASKARRMLGWSPALHTREGIEQAAAAWSGS
jgi:nucleoside-diphosphate-sugar epimerase